jgi:hypothetical protein
MTEIQSAVLVFILLLASTGVGAIVRPLLPEEHKAQETVQLVQLLVGMLVTFAALVLGLLTASAKTGFDTTDNDVRSYAAALIELDQVMRDYGADLDQTRALLRAYTSAAIASTWPSEPPPPGDYPKIEASPQVGGKLASPVLGAMLDRAQRQVRLLEPADAYRRKLAVDSATRFGQLIALRWKLIEEAHGSISVPFYAVLVFWLVVVFASFGLSAPRNLIVFITLGLGAVSIASAIFVILDLDTPFGGLFSASSQPLRDALMHLSQ